MRISADVKAILVTAVIILILIAMFLVGNAWYNEWKMIQRGQEVHLTGAPVLVVAVIVKGGRRL